MMQILGPAEVFGNEFRLLVSDPRHLGGQMDAMESVDAEQGFGNLLLSAIDSVNAQQTEAIDLAQAMITAPDEVSVHDVTIALANANLSLSMAKAVLDRGIQAYREIISIR
jgi:flagellar hook-basal body complex protein FliE